MGFVPIFRSLMNFELFWIICGRYRSNCIQYSVVCIWNSRYPSIICWSDYSPPNWMSPLLKIYSPLGYGFTFCNFHFILLIWMSDFMLLWSYFDYYSCIIYFEIEKRIPPTLFCFFKMISISGSLAISYEFLEQFVHFYKERQLEIWYRLFLFIILKGIDTLIIFSFPIHEHGVFFHYLDLINTFQQYFVGSVCRSYIFLVYS